jgi:hypothetical protein
MPNNIAPVYATQIFSGDCRIANEPYSVIWHDDTWEHDYGPTVPWAGHEDHTGGSPVVRPIDDLEIRVSRRAVRNVPRNVTRAELKRWHYYVHNVLYDEPNIQMEVSYTGPSLWDPVMDYASVAGRLYQTHCPAREAAEIGSLLVERYASIPDGPVTMGNPIVWRPESGIPDITFQAGDGPGSPADGVWNDRCPCFSTLSGVAYRHPNEYKPEVGYLFCPYHLGPFLYLDGERFGMVPVGNEVLITAYGVMCDYPTPAGWGWTEDRKYHWVSYYDSGWELTHHSFIEAGEGVLQILPGDGGDDEIDYGYSSAHVEWDNTNYAEMAAPSRYWGFELLGVCTGFAGGAEDGYGPQMDLVFGPARMESMPGIGLIGEYFPSYDWVPSPVDFFRPFRVRFVGSNEGWGIKMWQEGDPEPTIWRIWDTWSVDQARAYLEIWQDNGWNWRYGTLRPTMACRYSCMGYKFWDLTDWDDPIRVPSYMTQPTGGSVPGSEDGGLGAKGTGIA